MLAGGRIDARGNLAGLLGRHGEPEDEVGRDTDEAPRRKDDEQRPDGDHRKTQLIGEPCGDPAEPGPLPWPFQAPRLVGSHGIGLCHGRQPMGTHPQFRHPPDPGGGLGDSLIGTARRADTLGKVTNLPMLRREPADAQIAGVCAALAREWGVDPVLVRLGFVVAAIVTNGIAIAGYLIGWALIPQRGASLEPVRALLPFTQSWSRGGLIAAVIAVTVGGIIVTGAGPGALAIFGIVWLVLRLARRRRPEPPSPGPPRMPVPRTEFDRLSQTWQRRLDNVETGRPPTWDPPSYAPAPTPVAFARPGTRRAAAVRRRRSWRTWLAILAALAVAWGYLGTLVALGIPVAPLAWAATALAVSSVALLLVARPARAAYGRPGGLVPLTVVTALVTGCLLAVTPARMHADPPAPRALEAGELNHDTMLESGQQTVDLRGADVTASQTITYRQDLGALTVLMPETGNVRVHASVDLGTIETPDATISGIDNATTWERIVDPDAPVLTIRAYLDLGQLEVRA